MATKSKKKSSVRTSGSGFLILSAPHTEKVERPGETHLAETNLKKILMRLEKKLGKDKVSTITWKRSKTKKSSKSKKKSNDKQKTSKKKMDPNYFPKNKLDKSIWYKFMKKKLEQAKKEKKQHKLFLVDLHGMNNDKPFDIIIGFEALKKYLPKEKSRKIIANIIEVMERLKIKYKLKIGYNIIFKGFINENYYTVSQQSNSLGIPAIQIEMSRRVREKLVTRETFFTNFARTLNNLYKLNKAV